MIASKDRSGYFGASDVEYIVGNWKTKSWLNWYLTKLGISCNTIETTAMNAGTNWEHRILEHINCPEMDKQIIIPELLLRVNLDGNSKDTIFEVKTYKYENGYKLPKKHTMQVNVQMFSSGMRNGYIEAYGLIEEEYRNYFTEIDNARLSQYKISYDVDFIEKSFIPKIKRLCDCLKQGIVPSEAIET